MTLMATACADAQKLAAAPSLDAKQLDGGRDGIGARFKVPRALEIP